MALQVLQLLVGLKTFSISPTAIREGYIFVLRKLLLSSYCGVGWVLLVVVKRHVVIARSATPINCHKIIITFRRPLGVG